MAKSPKYRSMKQVREFEYDELMKLGRYEEALKIAEANEDWFQQEYQRWVDKAGEARLAFIRSGVKE